MSVRGVTEMIIFLLDRLVRHGLVILRFVVKIVAGVSLQRQAVATSCRLKTTSDGLIVFPGAQTCAGPRTLKSRLV